jgi:plastocyanin
VAGVVVALTGTAVLAVTSFPQGTGSDGDTGFVPQSKQVLLCENSVAKNIAKAVACITGCHKKRAAGKLDPNAEDACETSGPSSCQRKYNTAVGNVSKINADCPACLDPNSRAGLFSLVEVDIDSMNHLVYCDPNDPNAAWGGDDTGFIPTSKTILKCETSVGKALAKAVACISTCHQKAAAAALSGKKTFDEEACETSGPSSCLVKYATATGGASKISANCPPCLDPNARAALFTTAESGLDARNGVIYCGTTPPTTTTTTLPNTVLVGPGGQLRFMPNTLTVHVGDTVHWLWESSGHSVVSGTVVGGVEQPDGKFCSPNDTNCTGAVFTSIAGDTYAHLFSMTGTFPYYCQPHGALGMTGTITVQP